MNWKRKFAIVAVPAVLALAGGGLAVQASQTPPPSPLSTTTSSPEKVDATEAAETPETTEPVEAPGAADLGHADTGANAQADHQFEGNE